MESDRNRQAAENGKQNNRKPRRAEPVLIFDLNGNFIKRTSTQREAANFTKCHESAISLVCSGTRESVGEFVFRNEKDLIKTTKKYIY